jgi:hypothetical protein
LRECRVCSCGLHLGSQLGGLLRLDGAVDDCEHLACTYPAAGVDEDSHDLSALAGDADRLVTLGSEWTAGRDRAGDLPSSGHDDRNRRDLRTGTSASGLRRLVPGAAAQHDRKCKDDKRNDDRTDDHPPAPLARTVGYNQHVRRVNRSLAVHHSLPSSRIYKLR